MFGRHLSSIFINSRNIAPHLLAMEKRVCRICLAQNVRMHPIVNTELQQVFEQITNYLLLTEGRPLLACYICYTRLKQCHQLRVKCFQAEEIFAQMMKGKQLDQSFIDKLSSVNVLSITTLPPCPTRVIYAGNPDVKQEPVSEESDDDKQIKVELVENEVSYSTPNAVKEELVLDQTQTQAEDHHILSECGPPQPDRITWSEPKLLAVSKTETSKDWEVELGTTSMHLEDDKRHSATCDGEISSSKVFSYKCDVCQKCYKHKSGLNKHICVHTGVKPYECEVCQKSFRLKDTLMKHLTVHAEARPYMCDVCQKCFKLKDTLTKHLRVHTSVKEYKCDVCKECYRGKTTLNRHLLVHTGVKTYKCDMCDKSYVEKTSLNKHIRVHTGERPFKCDVCQKCFNQKGNLDKHLRMHNGVRPFKCTICQKSFTEKSNLNKHLRVHTGIKPFKCDVCQKCYSETSTLNKHLRIHSGERPYKCDVCQKSFYQRCNLDNHIRMHNNVRPYKCDVCQKCFIEKSNLNKHLRVHAGVKPNE